MSERDAIVIRTDAAPAGDATRVTLTVELPPGTHIEPHEPAEPTLVPTVLEVQGVGGAVVDYPEPVVKDLGWEGLTLTVLEGAVDFVVTAQVPTAARRIRGTLRYQPCVGGACLPPRTVPWEAPVSGGTAYSVLGALAGTFNG
jgi:DsbC/DsbD-like thiol-disulfide interchange protein